MGVAGFAYLACVETEWDVAAVFPVEAAYADALQAVLQPLVDVLMSAFLV